MSVARENSFYKCVIDTDNATLDWGKVFEWAHEGNTACLEHLIRKHPKCLAAKDDAGATPLHHATSGGSLEVIRLLVSTSGPEGLNMCDGQGNTPLHWAVEKHVGDSCALLLNLGANPNVLNAALMSPLHLAISKGHNDMVELLLSFSVTDVNLEGDLENTPVMLACSNNNCQALNILFKYGAKLCSQNKLGHYAIHAVTFNGSKEAMEVIIKKGEEFGHSAETHLNYLDKSQCSPLHLAVRGGNIEVIKLCIEKGARINQQQADKSTALHLACTLANPRLTNARLLPPWATIFDHVELAEYLISKGADIDCIDCKGLSPLLLATSCGAWRAVAFLLSKGANMKIKDEEGRNFLHLATFQAKGLKCIPEHILQTATVRDLLCDEDNEGCTPLHYACRLGIHDSVKNILVLQVCPKRKSKNKKSAFHFAAEYGRINTCHRLLERITDSQMLNEGDEHGLTPLHLACRGGHTKVVELLLRKGALFQSDYKGMTCLHHAAAEGYTQTMTILLAANVKLLDKADEDGNTALHLAAREGHVAAVKLLMERGASIVLNNSDASFFHEAVHHGKKEVADAIIDNERLNEAIKTFKHSSDHRCVAIDLIELIPESFKHLLDLCIRESDHDANSPDYHIQYNFQWLQAPVQLKKHAKTDKSLRMQPLACMNAMVQYHRVELLTHPVSNKYLEMKWLAYGSKVHLLNLVIYLLGLLPLTFLIINLRPTQTMGQNGTSVMVSPIPIRQSSYLITSSKIMVIVISCYAILKQITQMSQQKMKYLKDPSNPAEWATSIASLMFTIPIMFGVEDNWVWEAGAVAILLAWVNFLLYLQRFEHFGIYVVMFGEIIKTLFSVIVLVIFLVLAFGLSFYALMLHQSEFHWLGLSLAQTFVMMVGELNYQSNFFAAFEGNRLAFPQITYVVFVFFILLMPILLMNLMIGLAVGDIAEVQRNACLKRIAMQIDLHTNLEEKLPYWILKRVDKSSITVYPNKPCRNRSMFKFWHSRDVSAVRSRLNTGGQELTPVETELRKQKLRLREIYSVLEKQHSMVKLILQKMEITSEADDYDGPDDAHSGRRGRSKGPDGSPLSNLLSQVTTDCTYAWYAGGQRDNWLQKGFRDLSKPFFPVLYSVPVIYLENIVIGIHHVRCFLNICKLASLCATATF
ncbi:transient receptor potential cation channel subfamily A member 1b [Alosa alosa]|uniref:transient receptor potential cation channel subfamily A member 1b n=1 Tax=Alosa alosa TaxID=278164 RepID=UPI0020153385|nr:transient receptor potential cation channel subfamily A member 1b [Alosa alosa]